MSCATRTGSSTTALWTLWTLHQHMYLVQKRHAHSDTEQPYLGSCSITVSHQVSKGITQSHYNVLSARILLEQLDKYLEAIFIINYGCAAVIVGWDYTATEITWCWHNTSQQGAPSVKFRMLYKHCKYQWSEGFDVDVPLKFIFVVFYITTTTLI